MAEEKKTEAAIAATPDADEPHSQIYDISNRSARSTIAVIDAVTQRGGFKGEELSTIGQLRDQSIQVIQLCENYQQEQASK
jgi:hypothetical protein|tara:strand:- start:1204 stop:1446 length:243 start_codon:yes stop_codon:yes gene_type:complete